jgi:hypothetical protein
MACSDEEAPSLSSSTPATSATAGASAGTAPSAAATASAEPEPEIPAPTTPIVDLAGIATLPRALDDAEPRIGAVDWLVRVRAQPSHKAKVLGFLRAGAVLPAGAKPVGHDGCRGGWHSVEPIGYVCAGKDVTTDMGHPVLRAAAVRPDYAHRLPYMYGTVTRGGPVYARIPSQNHLEKFEPSLKKHLRKWRGDEVSGARYGLDVWLRYTKGRNVPGALEALEQKVTDDDIPWFLRDGGVAPNVSGLLEGDDPVKVDQVNRRQGRSFIYSFLHQGRRYNVTPDLVVVPADRFRPIRGSSFHGWQVDKQLEFPFALIRRPGARKWQWRASDKRMVDDGTLEWRSVVGLTGKQQIYRKRLYYQTKDGFYVDDRHASRVDPAKRWPKWAKQGEKWIDINLTKQVLVAYEGQKMVFATLISSGEAGLGDHEKTTATKRGIFRIHTKWVSVTMDSDTAGEEFELRDVPYVQYFEEGYALHGAYWHDRFGRPKSHGCINLAPEDARRLFFWTGPQVPPGWHGAMKALTGTIVFIHA